MAKLIKRENKKLEDKKDVIKRMYGLKDNVNFISRLFDENPKSIENYEEPFSNKYYNFFPKSHSTHLLAWSNLGNTKPRVVFPIIQEIDGELYDTSKDFFPGCALYDSLTSALSHGDYIEVDSDKTAEWLSTNYKKYFPATYDKVDRIDWDNNLAGKLIKKSENPSDDGLNPIDKTWSGPSNKKTDLNNRGYGIDINTNPWVKYFLKDGKLKANDERLIRYLALDEIADQLKLTKETEIDAKTAAIISAIYNRGYNKINNDYFKNPRFMKDYKNPDVKIEDFYNTYFKPAYEVLNDNNRSTRELPILKMYK